MNGQDTLVIYKIKSAVIEWLVMGWSEVYKLNKRGFKKIKKYINNKN